MGEDKIQKKKMKPANKKFFILGAIVVSILILVIPFLSTDADETHWLLEFFGKFHPLLVHLPIGILLGLFLLELVCFFRPSLELGHASTLLLWSAVITAIPSVLAGTLLAASGDYGSQTFEMHKWYGLATALCSIWLLVIRNYKTISLFGRFSLYRAALLVNVVLLSIAGHYGGSLTHGSNYLTKDLPDEIREFLGDDPYSMDGLLALDDGEVNKILREKDYDTDIKPIVNTYCYSCHGVEEQKGGLRLDEIDPDLIKGQDAETWRFMLDMVNSGEMPPEDEKQPTEEERALLVDWITASVQHAVKIKKAEQKPVIRRLTKRQYTHSVSSLLNLPIDFGDVLPEDGKSEMGFSNNGQVQQVSPLHIEYYKQIARQALDKAIPPPEKPASTRYKITFGKGIGVDQPAGKIGGYQSDPIDPDDFVIEILDTNGQPKIGVDSIETAHLIDIKENIGIGMRGSHKDRYQVVDDGVILYSALPHKEVSPKSWQGPSPNLKLLIKDNFPMNGNFKLRVKASKGQQLYSQRPGLIALRNQLPAENLTGKIQLRAYACREKTNLKLVSKSLVPKDLTENSKAKYTFFAPQDGYYQIDFTHPYVADDGMPSLKLRLDSDQLQERLHINDSLKTKREITTPITMAYLEKGEHSLEIGGRFFVGFSKVMITPYTDEHPVAIELKEEAEKSRLKFTNDAPILRAFAGARTDDGMDYKTFGDFKGVSTPQGKSENYTFYDRLENLPIPVIDTVETEILANIMIIGLWNDFLVKDNHDSGPPLLIQELEFEAPYHSVWPPESQTTIFFPSEDKIDKEKYTRQVLTRFMEKAYRRPLDKGEVDPYLEFWSSIKNDYERYEDSVKEVLVAVLCSPSFIYLAEPEEGSSDDEREFYLASRLAYFLWDSPPDSLLMDVADAGKLHRKKELKKQVQRMLQDDKSWRMIQQFSEEWLRIDRHKTMNTNVDEYEDFTRFVKLDMERETYHFVNYVLQKDMGIHNLIESNFALLNQNLAEFYGIDSVKGNNFRPVNLTADMHRGGLLSQGSFLSGHSDGTQAHAIKRAVWLKSKILGDRPPDPPPNVPELDPETPGFENLTLKEQLFIHRDKVSCMGCHRKIDAYGIVFENYNAVGLFQTEMMEKPIDSKTELPDGTVVDGIDGIKSYILREKKDEFTRSLVKHLFSYALGRDITFVDEREIESIVRAVKKENYRFQSVFENIVTSRSFRGEF
ncbi:MAG: DUF1592 domain-containing protein [Flavobacteriaceae bacterium]